MRASGQTALEKSNCTYYAREFEGGHSTCFVCMYLLYLAVSLIPKPSTYKSVVQRG